MSPTIANILLLVGSYGSTGEPTFHTFSFDTTTGAATEIQSLDGMLNPSFLAVADDGATILAVNENDGDMAAVTMLRRTAPGHYQPVTSRAVEGDGPCHVAVSPCGRYAVTSNYSGGSISIIDFDGDKGFIGQPAVVQFEGSGPVGKRQDAPHAHFTSFTPDGRLMVVDDLGTDRLHIFKLDRDGRPDIGSMHDVKIAPGSGPRHLVFDADGRNAFLINEIGGTVALLRYDAANATLVPEDYILADYGHGQGCGDIHLSPDGLFLYVSNRLKGDGIAVFRVNADGSLTASGFTPTGRHPRNFAITPDGNWVLVAARDDNRIEVFRRDAKTGRLTPAAINIDCPRPVCVLVQGFS